jgi:hypothetical protein
MQHGMLLHNVAVSSLVDRERLFNSETKKLSGALEHGVGNEKQAVPANPERRQNIVLAD